MASHGLSKGDSATEPWLWYSFSIPHHGRGAASRDRVLITIKTSFVTARAESASVLRHHCLIVGPPRPPSTVVVARLASGSLRFQENVEEFLGSLTTTREELVAPETVVERLGESDSVAPPSTTCVGTSHAAPYWTVLGAVVPGGQAAVL